MTHTPLIHGYLKFASENLDPLDVTKALRIPPTNTVRKGQPNIGWNPNGRIRDEGLADFTSGVWSVDSLQFVTSKTADVHARWLLRLGEGREAIFNELSAKYHGRIDLYVATPEFRVSKQLRERAEELGLEIVYGVG